MAAFTSIRCRPKMPRARFAMKHDRLRHRHVSLLVRVRSLVPLLILVAGVWPAAASSGVRATLAELSQASDVVLVGQVRRVGAAWEREVSGIFTYVTVDV